jgi:hypothetical protein
MPIVDKSKLKDGDILLYKGHKLISRIIQFFDKCDYSHASILMDDGRTLEANPNEVRRWTLADSVSRANSDPVSVVRLQNRPNDMQPVLRSAVVYEGARYAFEQILLLLLICSLRNARRNNFFFRLVRKAIEIAGSILIAITGGNKKAMICSELVYRAYNEALPGDYDPFAIVINRGGSMVSPFLFDPRISAAQDNLISFLYGSRSQLISIAPSNTPFVSSKNVLEKTKEYSTKTVTLADEVELEKLFNDLTDSYMREDYRISEDEVTALKASFDFYLAASVSLTSREALLASGNIVDLFLKENANFVTPGDFLRSSSVIKVGELDLSNL